MKEYEDLGHMEPAISQGMQTCYFLPNHPVLRRKAPKPKLGLYLMEAPSFPMDCHSMTQVGPTIQQDFYSVALLFKIHQVWFTADIAKIYRQIMLLPQNRDIEKFLGYILLKTPTRSTDSPVNYGTSSAPFLETRSEEASRHPGSISKGCLSTDQLSLR